MGEAVNQPRVKRQSQFCSGSNCNQNNFGGFFPGGGFAGFPIGGGFGATQNCFGSNCNQNNGRKKREIVLEEAVNQPRVKRQSQFCSGSNCNQNNFGGFGGLFPGGGFA